MQKRVTQVNNIFPKLLSEIEFFNLIPEMVLFLLCDKYSITKARSNIGLFKGFFKVASEREKVESRISP